MGFPLIPSTERAGLLPALRQNLPLYYLTTHGKEKQAMFCGISFRVFLTGIDQRAEIYRNFFLFSLHGIILTIFKNAKNGRKKTGNLFLISCFCVAVCGGGYLIFIPRKQIYIRFLKRFLCRWDFGCPALSFSASCISHLQCLTGSFRFPCSTRLQRFALL